MYVVPEDLREDFEHYRKKIEDEKAKKRSNGRVLYRYSRRHLNKQFVSFTKIVLVLGIGFMMLVFLCSLPEETESYSGTQFMYSPKKHPESPQIKHPQFGTPARGSATNFDLNSKHARPVHENRYVAVPMADKSARSQPIHPQYSMYGYQLSGYQQQTSMQSRQPTVTYVTR